MRSLQERLSYFWRDAGLLELALSHRSWANQQRGRAHNERLEFLGDAVLDLILADHLFRRFPLLDEGGLSQLRSQLVCVDALHHAAVRVELWRYLRVGRGEERVRGAPRVLADAMEAVVGSAFMDGQIIAAARVAHASGIIPHELSEEVLR